MSAIYKGALKNSLPTYWNKIVDEITKTHSKWVQKVSLLVMIYNHESKFGV